MSTYNPKLTITAAPGIAGHLLLVLYEAATPNVPVAFSAQLPPPHLASVQIQFNGLNPVNHIAKLFETDGVATTGTVLANFELDARFIDAEIRPDLFLSGGNTPGFEVDSKGFVDPSNSLKGWDYSLEIRGGGTMNPDTEYNMDSNNNPLMADGTYVAGGGVYKVQPSEIWVLHFFPKITTYTNSAPVVSNSYAVTEIITADRTLIAEDVGKNFIISGAGPRVNITLPPLSTFGENRAMRFMSEGGNHINAVFTTQGSDLISYMFSRDNLILAQGENMAIYKYSNIFRIENRLDGVLSVGEFFFCYQTDFLNAIRCEGQLLSRTNYARLWDYISNNLNPALVVNDTTWNASANNKGFFSSGDGVSNFRLPDLRNRYLRSASSSRLAASFEAWQVGRHRHRMKVKNDNPDDAYGYEDVPPLKAEDFPIAPTNVTRVETTDYNDTASTSDTENRTDNIAAYIMVKL